MAEAKRQSVFQTFFPPAEFAERRAKVFEAIGGEAVAVVQGAPPVRGFGAFRQSNEFHYLCGVEVPQSYLLLDGAERKTTLFLPDPAVTHAAGEGDSLEAEEPETVLRLTGVDAVCRTDALAAQLKGARHIFTPHAPAMGRQGSRHEARKANRITASDPWDGQTTREGRFLDRLRVHCPAAAVHDLTPILDGLCVIKNPREVEMLRRAGRLSGLAVVEAMRSTRPGIMEYHLAAIASYVFRVNDARDEGYRPIIPGGEGIWCGHYWRNDQVLRDGDLVLMDCAPDYGYYTSDIGRMFPVNGTYTEQQRELYGFVVEYHKAVLARIRPGITAEQVMLDAAADMGPVLDGWTFSKPIHEAAARKMLEFRGHMSHPVGMSVHDVGSYRAHDLAPGMVLTVDPQMWVPEEKTYVRCEDTVTVTADGMENFSDFVPLELDDVEAEMRKDGMLQAYPPDAMFTD